LLMLFTLLLCRGGCDALDVRPMRHLGRSHPRIAASGSSASASRVGCAHHPSVAQDVPTTTWEAILRARTRRLCGGSSHHRLRMCHADTREPHPLSGHRTIPEFMCKDGVCILQALTNVQAAQLFCRGDECEIPPPTIQVTTQKWGWVASGDRSTHRGVCTYWNAAKGYGFIAIVHSSAREAVEQFGQQPPSVFVHQSDVAERHLDGSRRLNVGDTLEFELARHVHSDRRKAVRVTALAPQVGRRRNDLDALISQLLTDNGSSGAYAP